jgi:primosomal protein N'
MARIVSRDTNESKAREAATLIAAALREAAESSLEVRGPIPCAVSRIANHYRFAIDALAPAAGTLQRALAHARARGLLRSDTKTAIDVDPVALM